MAILVGEIKEPKENLDRLLQAFRVGSPVDTACSFSKICKWAYLNWLYTYQEICRLNNYLSENKINNIKELTEDDINRGCLDIDLIQHIKKNKAYGETVCAFMKKVEEARAEIVIYHLTQIRAPKHGSQWNASAWFLERTMPGAFGRKDADAQAEKEEVVNKIEVQYVDPDRDNDRLKKMQKIVDEELDGKKEESNGTPGNK